MATCTEMVIKLFPSLKSYCLSLKPDEKDGKETAMRNNRITDAFKHQLAKVLLKFLQAALPPLIHLNLLIQRLDPLIHILNDALFTYVEQRLSRFASPELVRKFSNGDVTIARIKGEVMKEQNILNTSKMSQPAKFPEILDPNNSSSLALCELFSPMVKKKRDHFAIRTYSVYFVESFLYIVHGLNLF